MEYIELRNTGSLPIELAGAYFEAGSPSNDQFTFSQRTLQPGQFCVVTNNAAGFAAKYGNAITIAGEYTGSLSNDGERILLKDPQGNTIHDFVYDDVAPWPMAADGNGDYTRALGLELDARGFGMGMRGQRFALVIDNGLVRQAHVEAPGEFKVSSAEHVLSSLA